MRLLGLLSADPNNTRPRCHDHWYVSITVAMKNSIPIAELMPKSTQPHLDQTA